MSIKVLVVEDDAFLIKAYLAKLQNTGFEVHASSDGEEAMAALATFKPDIILLDLVMPRKDGFETLKEIRALAEFKTVPIFVASNIGQKEELDRALSMGATATLLKSDLSMSDLVDKIHQAVGR